MEKLMILNIINSICNDKGIAKKQVIQIIKDAFEKAYYKVHPDANAKVQINEDTGELKFYRIYNIVENIEDPEIEITFLEASENKTSSIINDEFLKEIDAQKFSRFAVAQIGQILKQQIKEAEKSSIYEEYKHNIDQLMSGKIIVKEENYYLLEVGRTFAFLSTKNMMHNDNFKIGDVINFYVENIIEKTRNSGQILASRIHKNFLVKLLEREVPEIFQKIVEVVAVSRDPGIRSKVAVKSLDENIDPIGACVGTKGSRIKRISAELNNEKIDICRWSEDFQQYLKNIFLPVDVKRVEVVKTDDISNEVNIYVPNDQFSLAIGKKGSVIRLCATLINYKINVISIDKSTEFIEFQDKDLDFLNTKVENNSNKIPLKPSIDLNIKENINSESKNTINLEPEVKKDVSKTEEISKPKNIQKEKLVEKEIEKVVVKEEFIPLNSNEKQIYKKYKIEFFILSSKIKLLNNKKYNDNKRAQRIKSNYIDLYYCLNDKNINEVSKKMLVDIMNTITIQDLKKSHIYIDKCEKEFEETKILENSKNIINTDSNPKIDIKPLSHELEYYDKLENREKELDDEYYDNINYDEYDEYYD